VTWRRARRDHDAQVLDTLERVIASRRRASLPVVIWRWWKELVLLAGAAGLSVIVGRSLGLVWAVIGVFALVGALAPPWPGWLAPYAWQLITPHLLRSGLYHARVQNRSGRRPIIVRVAREPFGERVRLWCPAGTSAEDLDDATGVLRAACWAADVRVTRDERRSHMVTVDIIRRRDDLDSVDGGPGDDTPEDGGQGNGR
jgi:hypothetical protein